MRKDIETEIKSKSIKHEFFCDKCNKHIMTSEEWPDGYYETPKDLERIRLEEYGWFKNNMELCDECHKGIVLQIKSELEKLGYEEER